MRKTFLGFFLLLIPFITYPQSDSTKLESFNINAQYVQEFVLGGYVQVREMNLEGNKMNFKDLGMTSFPSVRLQLQKTFQKHRSLSISYERFFINGKSHLNGEIAFNGTIINGSNGIDVSPTRYYRISAFYSNKLLSKPHLILYSTVGLIYDHITFYIDGEVSPGSPRDEVFESFGRQAFPYPVVGLNGDINLGALNKIHFELSGTYIPKFKSFFTEVSRVYLQYSTFQSELKYSRTISAWKLDFGARFRFMHLFQESIEDTNEITTLSAGPFVGINYRF